MKKETWFHFLFGKAAPGGVACLFALLSCFQVAVADTTVGGYITTDATWDAAGSPYIVTSTVTVYNGATLTIEPGVEVRFNPSRYLQLGSGSSVGTLIAEGTEDNKIRFTASDSDSPWHSLYFTNRTGEGSVLNHAIVENGGSAGYLVYVHTTSNVTIENTIIRNSSGHGLRLDNNATPVLGENSYADNVGYPIYVNGSHSISAVDSTSTFTDNGDNRIYYAGGYITTDQTVKDPGIPYFVDNTIAVYGDAILTLDAGTELQFDSGRYLQIGSGSSVGTLIAEGTEDNKIRFTASDSDSPWHSLYFTNRTGEGSVLNHAIVENGGSAGYLVYVHTTSNVTIENTIIRNSSGHGLRLDNNATPVLGENSYADNVGYPIYVNGSHSISAVDSTSTFTDNGDNRIYYAGGYITTDQTVKDPGIPYFVPNTTTVYNGAILTLEPGTELQFDSGRYLQIGSGSSEGKLTAQGTDNNPVTFTSAASTPASGDWSGIYFTNKTAAGSTLENAIVEYATRIDINGSNPVIKASTLRHSNYGLYIHNSSPEISCNTITANTIGIYAQNAATPVLYNNDIRGNTTYGLQKAGTSMLNAEDNYWGAADGPAGAGSGSGDAVAGAVNFTPFLTASAPCTAPLNASFSATPTSGCEALAVNFTDGSTGGIDAWAWDFDTDGTVDSTVKNPSWTYTEPGIHTATLTVYEGSDFSSTTAAISVLESVPAAAFSALPVNGEPPLTVAFTDESQNCGTDSIVAWAWDFDNDGIVDSNDQNPSNVFYNAGNYTVSLTVTDSDGDSDTLTKADFVSVSDEAPVAVPGGPYAGTEGQPIQLDGSGSYDPNGGPTTFAWDFNGDGMVDSTEEQPEYTFAQDSEEQSDGVYTVTLTVTDETGMTGVATTTVEVADTSPQADFNADVTTGTQPLNVQFGDSSSSYDGIASWHWSFGDGTESMAQNPEYTYTQAGTYTVTLEVTEQDGDTGTKARTGYITVGSCTDYYYDADGDGYGTSDSQCLASPAAPYTAQVSGDCDDSDASINPGAEEVCGDGIDNNCSGQVDETCPVGVPGDLDDDLDVDQDDYLIFRSTLGKCTGASGFIAEADYDADGCVTYSDYRTWYHYFRAANQPL